MTCKDCLHYEACKEKFGLEELIDMNVQEGGD